jgi:hypothetical protein
MFGENSRNLERQISQREAAIGAGLERMEAQFLLSDFAAQ